MKRKGFKGIVNFISYDVEYHEYTVVIDGGTAKCDPFLGHSERSKKLKGMYHVLGKWDGTGDERCLLVDDLKPVESTEIIETSYSNPPKLKASLIYDRFRSLTYISHTRAKKLAKTTAEEAREAVYALVIHIGENHEENVYYQYWKTVIKEINKI